MSNGYDLDDDWSLSSSISANSKARLLAEFAGFCQHAAEYATQVVPQTAELREGTCVLARRMLEHMLIAVDPGESISPAELADDIGERKRKAVRECGRLLHRLGLIDVQSEPCDTPEGERVLGYTITGETAAAFKAYDRERSGRGQAGAPVETGAAPKQ